MDHQKNIPRYCHHVTDILNKFCQNQSFSFNPVADMSTLKIGRFLPNINTPTGVSGMSPPKYLRVFESHCQKCDISNIPNLLAECSYLENKITKIGFKKIFFMHYKSNCGLTSIK